MFHRQFQIPAAQGAIANSRSPGASQRSSARGNFHVLNRSGGVIKRKVNSNHSDSESCTENERFYANTTVGSSIIFFGLERDYRAHGNRQLGRGRQGSNRHREAY